MRQLQVSAIVFLLAIPSTACGRVGFDVVSIDGGPGAGDAGRTDGGADGGRIDGGSVPGTCDWSAGVALSSARELTEVNGRDDDFDPFVTADHLDLYFASQRAGDTDIYTAHRDDRASPFGAPVPVGHANTTADELRYELRPDGLTALLSTNRGGGLGGFDIWVATRSDRGGVFSPFINLAEVNSAADDHDPHFARGGLQLWQAVGAGDQEIVMHVRAGLGDPFGPSTAVDELNSTASDSQATLTADGLTVVFASRRAGGPFRLYYATRVTADSTFGTTALIPGQPMTGVRVYEPFITTDGCELFYAVGPINETELWHARFAAP